MTYDSLHNEDEKEFLRRQARYGASLQNTSNSERGRRALMNYDPPPPNWGCQVLWTELLGGHNEVRVSGYRSLQDARQAAKDLAIAAGWTPRKWWQWWRFGDTPNL